MTYTVSGAYTPASAAETASAGKTIKSADWNAVNTDIANALNQLGLTLFNSTASVNFNAGNTDTQIAITLPTGFTNYVVEKVFISKASQTLVTATCGLFTAAAAGGVAIVTGGSAITVNTAAVNTNNNTQSLTVNNQFTESYNVATLFFRVGTAEGVAATGTVTLVIRPVS